MGEIYGAAHWYEKQDVIKQLFLKIEKKKFTEGSKGKLSSTYSGPKKLLAELQATIEHKIVPDFYNIMLERHKDDPEGYNLVVVDPILKGNFSSRFSHSCNANCGTVTTVSNGKYRISMYALRDIQYGEELTFDYCSNTDDKREYENAKCLCGEKTCRGYYLELVKSGSKMSLNSTNILDNQKNFFLSANAILYKACIEPCGAEDEEILAECGLKESVLYQFPTWLRKWAALTLKMVKTENESLLKEFELTISKEKESSSFSMTSEKIKEIFDRRLHNLVITLSKVREYIQREMASQVEEANQLPANELAKIQENLPKSDALGEFDISRASKPLVILNSEEALNFLWGKRTGVRNAIDDIFSKVAGTTAAESSARKASFSLKERASQVASVSPEDHAIIQELQKIIGSDSNLNEFESRKELLKVSVLVQKLSIKCLNSQAMADIIYFYAFTSAFFKAHSFKGVQTSIKIRLCDLTFPEKYLYQKIPVEEEAETVYEDTKKLSSQYIWGQLVGWLKQTVEKPEASLSQNRRGTVTYPEFSGSFFKEAAKTYEELPVGTKHCDLKIKGLTEEQKRSTLFIEVSRKKEEPSDAFTIFPSFPHSVIPLCFLSSAFPSCSLSAVSRELVPKYSVKPIFDLACWGLVELRSNRKSLWDSHSRSGNHQRQVPHNVG